MATKKTTKKKLPMKKGQKVVVFKKSQIKKVG